MTIANAPEPADMPDFPSLADLDSAETLGARPGPTPETEFRLIKPSGEDARPLYIIAQAEDHADDHGDDEHADDHAEDDHGDDAHGDDAHADEHGHGDAHGHDDHGGHHEESYGMPAEFPNVYSLIAAATADPDAHHGHGRHHTFPFWVNPLFAAVQAGIFLIIVLKILSRRSVDRPTRGQMGLEMIFMGFYNFFGDVVGKENARKFVPFVSALWFFIFINHFAALVPGLKTPWATYFQVGEMGLLVPVTISLGIITFFWVNGHAIKEGGLGHFFWHLCGSPTDAVGWAISPLMFLLELIGTFIKPISLSLRLFGNTLGGDKLLAVFLGLGMTVVALIGNTSTPLIGIPFHFPFLFLELLVGLIQATVFSMLAAVYVSMLLPHHDHHEEHEEEHATA